MSAPRRLKVERYAEAVAHVAHLRDPAEEILELFDVLAQAWAKKLAGDATLMGRFKDLARQDATSGKRAT